jgi:peptide/nickel transport system permease protein
MIRFILKRLLYMIPVLFGVTILIFTIMYFVPGDYAAIALGQSATMDQLEAYREKMGLNAPYLVRLFNYFKGMIFHLDLGTSLQYKTPVLSDLISRFPRTLTIVIGTVLVGFGIGIPLGIIAAVNQNSLWDRLCLFISLIGISMPDFWLALMLVILFALRLGWLPPLGIGGVQYFILPVLANAAAGLAGNVRLVRTSLLEVIRADYISTARSKGLSERMVLFKHAFPNSLIPVVTSIGNLLGAMLGGSLVIETVFSIPGIGQYMVRAISARDYPVVQGSVIFLAFLLGFVMLFVDIVYAFIDPRIKAQYKNRKI